MLDYKESFTIMTNNYDVKDLGQAEMGRQRIDWAAQEMPVLQLIK